MKTALKICVAGLGLIGGSLCLALKRAGYAVHGWNRSQKPLAYALEHAFIDGAAEDFSAYDVVFIAMPLEATLAFLDGTRFADNAIVADICGVKEAVEKHVFQKRRFFRYVGCHPMAGKEVSGVENACADLFDGASMVITHTDCTDRKALNAVCALTRDMGFGRIVSCTAAVHDRKIAYTSQLAHVVSNAYVKDGEIECCLGFTGGSFQDMTRIAGVDEGVWASLYLANAGNLSQKIGSLIGALAEIKDAVDGGDGEKLKDILRRGRELYAESQSALESREIQITLLK